MEQWHGIKPKNSTQTKHLSSNTAPPRGKSLNLNKNMTDKTIEDELARVVQQLLALNKTEQSTSGKNISNIPDNDEYVLDIPYVSQDLMENENDVDDEMKTPENPIPAENLEHGKKLKNGGQTKRSNKRSLLDSQMSPPQKKMQEVMVLDGTPKRPRYDHEVSQ